MCVHVHACVCMHVEIGKGEQGHPFETPSCSSLWCDGRPGAHTYNFVALINPCLTGKISKGIFKHLPSLLLTGLSREEGKPGGSGEVGASAVEGADVITISGTEIALGTGTGKRTGSCLAPVFQLAGRCYASAAGLPDGQMNALKGGSGGQSSITHLEPINEAGVSCVRSGAVLQRPGRDPCAPAYGEREVSFYPQPKNEILSGVRSRIWSLQLRKSLM